jgi:hypothetical protein
LSATPTRCASRLANWLPLADLNPSVTWLGKVAALALPDHERAFDWMAFSQSDQPRTRTAPGGKRCCNS